MLSRGFRGVGVLCLVGAVGLAPGIGAVRQGGTVPLLLSVQFGGPAPVTWFVDLALGSGGIGTEPDPFGDLAGALGVAADGDTVRFLGDGSISYTLEAPRIETALRLEADNGPVRIGGPVPGAVATTWLPGNLPLEMVWIPGGSFLMGRYPDEQDGSSLEDPRHEVTLAGFWMARYELTKEQWFAIMGTRPWNGRSYTCWDPDSPAVWISWDDAQVFIAALNAYTGLTFRLPTESEWEYACRAGTTTRFYWGDDPSYTVGDDYAWWIYNYSSYCATEVGQKLPNPWGLYDMSGNVTEFCQDWFHLDYVGAPADGSAVDTQEGDQGRAVRGGNWYSSGYYLRSAKRDHRYMNFAGGAYDGFRLAR